MPATSKFASFVETTLHRSGFRGATVEDLWSAWVGNGGQSSPRTLNEHMIVGWRRGDYARAYEYFTPPNMTSPVRRYRYWLPMTMPMSIKGEKP